MTARFHLLGHAAGQRTCGSYLLLGCFVIAVSVTVAGGCRSGEKVAPPTAETRLERAARAGFLCDRTCAVTVGQLLARPEVFDGVLVQVVGFLSVGFEESALLPRRDTVHPIPSENIWLEFGEEDLRKYGRLSGRYVVAVGTYQAGRSGHLDGYPGKLVRIQVVNTAD